MDFGELSTACKYPDYSSMDCRQMTELRKSLGYLCQDARDAIKQVQNIRKMLAQHKKIRIRLEIKERKMEAQMKKERAQQNALNRKILKENARLAKSIAKKRSRTSKQTVTQASQPIVQVPAVSEDNCQSLGLNPSMIANSSQSGKWVLTTSGTANENITLTRRFRILDTLVDVLDTSSPLEEDVFQFQYKLARSAEGVLSFKGFVMKNISSKCYNAHCHVHSNEEYEVVKKTSGGWLSQLCFTSADERYIAFSSRYVDSEVIFLLFKSLFEEIKQYGKESHMLIWQEVNQLNQLVASPIRFVSQFNFQSE